MKARFLEPQLPVRIISLEGKIYIYICVNEQQEEDIYDNPDGTKYPLTYYEYDYNEFCDSEESLDLEDVKLHPQNYLNYQPSKADKLESKIKKEIEKTISNNLLSTNSNQSLSAPMGAALNLRLEALEAKIE